jgi:threonine dehydrogenase-like Zn-dependent dehydrogenase
MRGAVLHAPGDVRFEERDDPKIIEHTDAIIRISATCVCGSDLWDYRGINSVTGRSPVGHEYCGIVEEVGSAVSTIKTGQFVIGSFFASDGGIAGPARRRDAGHVPGSLTTIRCPACSPPRMCWVLAGSPRLLPMCSAA